MSNRDDVKPQAMMRYMEDDESSVAGLSHSTRRVKIEDNWTWNLRFLPVQMGADKMPYVRLARHWRNKSPIYCPQWTPKSYGGNPDAVCPICATAERLIQSNSEDVRQIGFNVACKIARKFWCVVLDMQDPRGRIDEMPLEEFLNPYEMEMTKTTWEDYKKYQKLAQTRSRDTSEYLCLDLETGCNFLATSTNKGVRLDRSDPSHILDAFIELSDPNWDKYIAKIWSRVRQPIIQLPTDKQINDFVAKVEEDADGGARGRRRRDDDDDRGRGRGGRGGGRGFRDEDDRDSGGRGRGRFRDDAQEEDRPARRRSTEDFDEPEQAPRRRQQEEAEPEQPRRRQQESAPEAEAPRRRQQESAPEAEAPRRRQQQADPEPEPEAEAPQEQEQAEAPTPPARRGQVANQAPSAPPPARRQQREPEPEPEGEADAAANGEPEAEAEAPTPPPRRSSASAPSAPPPARRQAPAGDNGGQAEPPPRRRQAPAAQQEQQGVDEEEDNTPEEKSDPAPARREPLEEAPPAVSAKAPAPAAGRNPEDLQARLAKLNTRKA